MTKIFHTSDIHIKNLSNHETYKKVFKDLYKKIEEEQPDYVVVAGDVAHTKTTISPEFVEMASNFFREIANRSKLVLMLGNHDGSLKNLNRQDAISPIVDALNHSNIHFLKHSGVLEFEDVSFYVLSEFDKENWIKPKNKNTINIAIYHGTIAASQIDSGFELAEGDSREVLKGFDYAILGDIHKRQQICSQDYEYLEIDNNNLEDYLNAGWEIIP